MIEKQSGDLAQLCGLLNTLVGFKQLVQNPGNANLALSSYPMAEFWSEIFDDHRILDFAGGLAASCGLPERACKALENLVRSLTKAGETGVMTGVLASGISSEIEIVIEQSRGWCREHCDLDTAPAVFAVDVNDERPKRTFAVGGDS